MRVILFRGKAANRDPRRPYRTNYKNGDWVYGLLTDPMNYAGFAEMTNTNGVRGIEVDKNTVGQFTGLTSLGEGLYEGDIVQYGDELMVVEWVTESAGFVCRSLDGSNWHHDMSDIHWGAAAIVGNIHDNPELMSE